jgi:hypothetical protein
VSLGKSDISSTTGAKSDVLGHRAFCISNLAIFLPWVEAFFLAVGHGKFGANAAGGGARAFQVASVLYILS